MAEKTIEELKDLADELGIKYHPSISASKLADKIDNFAEVEEEPEPDPTPIRTAAEIRKEATALVRVRVTCMNPAKSAWDSEIFCVGNRHTGNLKKLVPFDVEWHVPKMILDMIQSRKCQIFQSVKRKTAQGVINAVEGKIVKEYNVEILPPLTEKELEALAQRQAMAAGTAAA